MKQATRKSEVSPALCNKGKKSHKFTGPYHLRPRNAFILFRQYYHHSVQGKGPHQKNNSEVSKELGLRWRSLPPQEKSYWENLARQEKELFARKREEYRFVNEGPSRVPEKNDFSMTYEVHSFPPVNENPPLARSCCPSELPHSWPTTPLESKAFNHKYPLLNGQSLPPISKLMSSQFWHIPSRSLSATPVASHFGTVSSRICQLPFPRPQQSTNYIPFYQNLHHSLQRIPSLIASPLGNTYFTNYPTDEYRRQQISGNSTLFRGSPRPLTAKSDIRHVLAPHSILNA